MLLAALMCIAAQETKPEEKPAPPPRLSIEQIREAGQVIGLDFSPDQLKLMQKSVAEQLDSFERLQKIAIDNSLPPATSFSVLLPGMRIKAPRFEVKLLALPDTARPADLEDLAFETIPKLASLIRSRKVSCVELTKMYLARLKRLDPKLVCVVNYTEERALAQAAARDLELRDGHWRGVLHGLPWGAKDLLAVAGTPTTWGSKIHEHQMLDTDAAVVKKLDDAGAILIAKMALGEFAYGDLWFGGRTRNPWKLEDGSSGSSAGSASATAAGCMAFAIGSETLGSLVSPATVCGATALRPTFGRVARTGAMALSWTMDKLGPLCRSVEDASLVFAAIQGADGVDPSAVDHPFTPLGRIDVKGMKVGYIAADFEKSKDDQHVLDELKELDVELVPIDMPASLPVGDMLLILTCEAAAAFDELTRNGEDERMVWQAEEAWPNVFRSARLIPAVEYIRANRLRTQLMRDMQHVMDSVDLYVHPSRGGTSLLVTNLTGHPTVVAPDGFRADGTPRSISFTGQLFGEAELCAFAQAWQEMTGYHRRHPRL